MEALNPFDDPQSLDNGDVNDGLTLHVGRAAALTIGSIALIVLGTFELSTPTY